MKNLVLAIDASTPRLLLALGEIDGGRDTLVAARGLELAPNQSSEILVPEATCLLRAAGVGLRDLALVACGRGPGSFTGTRVAVASAKGFALGLGVETLPVSTLAVIACSAASAGRVLATLDAGRDEVYAAIHRVPESPGAGPILLGEESLAPRALVIARHAPGGSEAADHHIDGRDANERGLWRATVETHRTTPSCDPDRLEVVYLRKSYAELGVNAPKRPFVRSPFA